MQRNNVLGLKAPFGVVVLLLFSACGEDRLKPLDDLILKFEPPPGEYDTPQKVRISIVWQNKEVPGLIHFTMDGTEPAKDEGEVFFEPIPLTGNGFFLFKAIGDSPRTAGTGVQEAYYDIRFPKLAAPLFNPSPGIYSGSQTVTLTSPTPGAEIWYTIDGTEPKKYGKLYDGPIEIKERIQTTTDVTIKAFARKQFKGDSDDADGTYTIDGTLACAGQYKFKCKAGKGEFCVLGTYCRTHQNNKLRWPPATDPIYAPFLANEDRLWFYDELGYANDHFWMRENRPRAPHTDLIDENGKIVGKATLHICSFDQVQMDAGGQEVERAKRDGWYESDNDCCRFTLADNARDPQFGGAQSCWEIEDYRTDPATNQSLTPRWWYKRRNNM